MNYKTKAKLKKKLNKIIFGERKGEIYTNDSGKRVRLYTGGILHYLGRKNKRVRK